MDNQDPTANPVPPPLPAPPVFCHECGNSDPSKLLPSIHPDDAPLCRVCLVRVTPLPPPRVTKTNVTLGELDWYVSINITRHGTGASMFDPGDPPEAELEEAYPFGCCEWPDLLEVLSDEYREALLEACYENGLVAELDAERDDDMGVEL